MIKLPTMKNVLLVFSCFFSLVLFAQNISDEELLKSKTDSLDLFFSFPCIAFNGEFGIEKDRNEDEFYTTQWTGDSVAMYGIEGNLIDKFVIPGVSNIRDLAYDGVFFYGGTNDTVLYVMDYNTRTLVVAVEMPFKIQGIAFDEWDLVFWVCEEGSPIAYQIDASGANLGYIELEGYDSINITGLAFCDQYCSYSPTLWLSCQDGSRSLLIKYDIYGQQQVGYEIDLSTLVSGDNQTGGLFFRGDFNTSYISGIIQDELVFAFELDYANQLVNSDEKFDLPKFEIYPNPASDKVYISTSFSENKKVVYRIFNQSSKVLYENSLSSPIEEIDINNYPPGTYFIQLIGDEGYSFTKKFQKY